MVETKLTKAIELAKSDTLCAVYEATRASQVSNHPGVYDALQDALAALDKALTESRKVT